jgi:RNA polymerase sigma-70 factor (ECF subfamily)
MIPGTSEAGLLQRASRGDESAFLLLYERHRRSVFGFAYRLLGSVPVAEDITQECFMSLVRRPDGFQEGRASLRTYLCAAARNLAYKYLRKQGVEIGVDDLPEQRAPEQNRKDALQQLLDQEVVASVRKAVEALPPLQREAVVLFEYEEMSLAEIATVCGVDVGTIKARLHRARERLRRELGPILGEEAQGAKGVQH